MLGPVSFSILCIARNEPELQVGISKRTLPGSFGFAFVAGEVMERTGCRCLVSAVDLIRSEDYPEPQAFEGPKAKRKISP